MRLSHRYLLFLRLFVFLFFASTVALCSASSAEMLFLASLIVTSACLASAISDCNVVIRWLFAAIFDAYLSAFSASAVSRSLPLCNRLLFMCSLLSSLDLMLSLTS